MHFVNTALVGHDSLYMYIMLKDFKHLQTPGRFPNTLIHQIHRTDEVRTWCLILNKINSEKFYIHW